MTIADKLTSISATKQSIKAAIEAKSVTVGSIPFSQYANKISEITGTGGDPLPPDWVRPADWLPMPTVLANEQKFVALFAVFNHEANDVAFVFGGGAYTVDWGDGVIENFSSNAKASHLYNYSLISDSTLSSRGYKQVIITVTPQAGQNITKIDLVQSHPTVKNSRAFATCVTQYLELIMNIPNVGGSPSNFYLNNSNTGGYHSYLESVTILSIGAITSLDYVFANMSSLQNINAFNVSSVTSASYAFNNCALLKRIPEFNFTAITNCGSMFFACRSLVKVDAVFSGNITTCISMFNRCSSLKEAPNINTAYTTNMSSMFYNCYSLTTVPLYNTASATNMSSMFYNCIGLGEIPFFNTVNVTDMSFMFFSCYTLKSIPLFNTSKVININSMFFNCSSLSEIPSFDFSKVTNPLFDSTTSASFASGCSSLTKVGSLDFSKITSANGLTYAFSYCYALQEIGNISIAPTLGTSSFFVYNTYGLSKVGSLPFNQTFTLADCSLSPEELNNIFTKLPVVTGKTITVTGNYGAATCDTTIATAKGWTVTR